MQSVSTYIYRFLQIKCNFRFIPSQFKVLPEFTSLFFAPSRPKKRQRLRTARRRTIRPHERPPSELEQSRLARNLEEKHENDEYRPYYPLGPSTKYVRRFSGFLDPLPLPPLFTFWTSS